MGDRLREGPTPELKTIRLQIFHGVTPDREETYDSQRIILSATRLHAGWRLVRSLYLIPIVHRTFGSGLSRRRTRIKDDVAELLIISRKHIGFGHVMTNFQVVLLTGQRPDGYKPSGSYDLVYISPLLVQNFAENDNYLNSAVTHQRCSERATIALTSALGELIQKCI